MYLFSSTPPPFKHSQGLLDSGPARLGIRNGRARYFEFVTQPARKFPLASPPRFQNTLLIRAVTAEVSKARVALPRINSLPLIVRQWGPVRLWCWQVDADQSDIVIAQFFGSSQSVDPHVERRGIPCVKRAQKRPRIPALFIFL